jgi:hypothetical protein
MFNKNPFHAGNIMFHVVFYLYPLVNISNFGFEVLPPFYNDFTRTSTFLTVVRHLLWSSLG